MADPTLAISSDGLREALDSWAAKWIAKAGSRCDWCTVRFTDVSELREFIAWCLTLREAWPSQMKRLPADKVFCVTCAVGAMLELHGGPRYVARRYAEPAREMVRGVL